MSEPSQLVWETTRLERLVSHLKARCRWLRDVWRHFFARCVLLQLKLSRRKIIIEYFNSSKTRKLQLGSGSNKLPGWLNSDGFIPSSFTDFPNTSSDYVFIDTTKSFPFEDAALDYIFHEHLIEHMDYQDGQRMLSECFRVLKPGGKIRVSTPDFQVFVNLYSKNLNPDQIQFLSEYVRFNSDVWSNDLKGVNANYAVFVLNHNFRAWGHQFIYDYDTLEAALRAVGFQEVERQSPQVSKDVHLRSLEFRKEFVGIFDALIVEAMKPLGTLA